MKTVLSALICVAVVLAEDGINWSIVKRRDIRLPLPFDLEQVVFDQKIVGGEEAIPHSIPYQAGLLINTSETIFFCGGSLISNKFILTSAHCVEGATEVEVRIGAHRIVENEDSQQRFLTNKFVIHQGWDRERLENDIAVVELPTSAALNSNVQIVSLPRYSDVENDLSSVTGTISGWGVDSNDATGISLVLRYILARVMNHFICNVYFSGIIKPTHVCTSGDGGRGACTGDSGGPLLMGNRQFGLVSFGIEEGCEIGWPTVFTRITSYLDWIEANTDVAILP